MSRIGIGLIGVGTHGTRYATHITRDLPDLRLVAIARRDAAAGRLQAAQFGCRAYVDYHEMMAAPDIDAVILVVPPTAHPEIMAAAAAARRPVLLEKPAAANLNDGLRILHAVRAAGIPVMVAQTVRFTSVVRVLLQERDTIGRLHGLRLSQRFEPSRPGWIDVPAIAGGGMILHTGVHLFDLARLLTGMEADRVSCEMTRVRTTHTEDNFAAIIRFGNGDVLADIAGSRATASRCGTIDMAGEHGQLVADHIFNTAWIVRGAVRTPLAVPPPVQTVPTVLRQFTQALRTGTPMPVPLEEGLRAVAIADACYASARSGKAEGVSWPRRETDS
jgi:predicted dehydrogenase